MSAPKRSRPCHLCGERSETPLPSQSLLSRLFSGQRCSGSRPTAVGPAVVLVGHEFEFLCDDCARKHAPEFVRLVQRAGPNVYALLDDLSPGARP